jgi:hypothetical protein
LESKNVFGGGIGGASGASYAYSQIPLDQVLEEFLKDQKKKRLLSEYLRHNIPDQCNLSMQYIAKHGQIALWIQQVL